MFSLVPSNIHGGLLKHMQSLRYVPTAESVAGRVRYPDKRSGGGQGNGDGQWEEGVYKYKTIYEDIKICETVEGGCGKLGYLDEERELTSGLT